MAGPAAALARLPAAAAGAGAPRPPERQRVCARGRRGGASVIVLLLGDIKRHRLFICLLLFDCGRVAWLRGQFGASALLPAKVLAAVRVVTFVGKRADHASGSL